MNARIKQIINWANNGGDDFAERWDVDADDIVTLDPEGAAKMRAIAASVRDCAEYFRSRSRG